MPPETTTTTATDDFLPARPDGPPKSLAELRRERMSLNPHPNLKDKAAAYLRDEILSGNLRAGEKIDQEEVAGILGISRLPVREALIELAQENLVDWIPRRGSFVATITENDILDLYEIQGMISGIAARRAATRLTDQELVLLAEIHSEYLKAEDPQLQSDISFAFHQVILDAGGSNRIRSVLRLLYRSLPIDYFEATPSWKHETVRHHEELLAALQARDGDAAALALQRQLTDSGRLTLDVLRARGLWKTAEPV